MMEPICGPVHSGGSGLGSGSGAGLGLILGAGGGGEAGEEGEDMMTKSQNNHGKRQGGEARKGEKGVLETTAAERQRPTAAIDF